MTSSLYSCERIGQAGQNKCCIHSFANTFVQVGESAKTCTGGWELQRLWPKKVNLLMQVQHVHRMSPLTRPSGGPPKSMPGPMGTQPSPVGQRMGIPLLPHERERERMPPIHDRPPPPHEHERERPQPLHRILPAIHIHTLHLLTHQCTAPTRNIVKVVQEGCLVKASSMPIQYPSGAIARGSVMSEKTIPPRHDARTRM